MANIEIEVITKTYNGVPVLRDLSLSIAHGECFTLLGPSGCGKTVLMRLLSGFERPNGGRIRIGDRLVAAGDSTLCVPPNERGLGVVFQDYAVWPHMSVRDNIGYPLKIAKIPDKELALRVDEAISQVNLDGLADRLPSQLSGGQQQRVALARALVAKPALLLLDEPLCNLDAGLREEMRFEIKELQKNLGITILYVTHDQEIALALADRLAIMDESGCIRQVGTPEQVYERPVDRFVFHFLGMANVLPAALFICDGRIRGVDPPGWLSFLAANDASLSVGFRPSDVCLARDGEGLACRVKRASFLGAMIDYLLEVEGRQFRTQVETRQALDRNLVFHDGDPCTVRLRAAQWFSGDKRADKENGR